MIGVRLSVVLGAVFSVVISGCTPDGGTEATPDTATSATGPIACPGPGKPKVPLQGDWTCVGNLPTLSGELPVNDPRVTARLVEASRLVRGPVAYTNGAFTQTYFPTF